MVVGAPTMERLCKSMVHLIDSAIEFYVAEQKVSFNQETLKRPCYRTWKCIPT